LDDSKTTPTLGCEASYHFVNGVQPTGDAVQCDAWQGTVGAVDKQPLVFKDRRSKSVNGMAVNGTELKGLA
jgi:sRNA-binding regulator protein Hfq